MAISDQIYELVKSLPQAQAGEVLTFAEFVHAKYSTSKAHRATASLPWPDLVRSLEGAWEDDFPALNEIRVHFGQGILRKGH